MLAFHTAFSIEGAAVLLVLILLAFVYAFKSSKNRR